MRYVDLSLRPGPGKSLRLSGANGMTLLKQIFFASGIGLLGGPVLSGELICDVIGTQYAEWQGNDYQLSQSKAYQWVHKMAFVTGEQPKIAYLDKQKADWVWEHLDGVPTKAGLIYTAVLDRGGVLSAVLNGDETRIVVNYVSKAVGSVGAEDKIFSTSGIGQCFRR